MLQYHYTYGNEDVLSAEIKVIKDGEFNTITFTQQGFDVDAFDT